MKRALGGSGGFVGRPGLMASSFIFLNLILKRMDLNLRAPHVRVAHKYFNPKSASKLEFIVLIWAYLKSFNIVTKKLIEKNSFKILSQNLFLG